MLSQEAFNIAVGDNLFDSNTIHGAIVVIDGKLWMDRSYNRFLFPDRQKAMRAFYDCMKWQVRHKAYKHSTENRYRNDPRSSWGYIGENGYLFTSEEVDTCMNWRQFKKELIDHHGFQIIEI